MLFPEKKRDSDQSVEENSGKGIGDLLVVAKMLLWEVLMRKNT